MPIIAIHEEVAIKLAKQHKNLDTKDFYLGTLAPDTVNLNFVFAPKLLRWTAHQRSIDLSDWKFSLKDFYQKEKTNYPRNFILGYITHILTDIIFDESFYLDITDKMLNDNISNEETHNLMRKDMENYASNSKYKNIIKEKLSNQDKFYNILNITEEELKIFTKKNLDTCYKITPNKYITEDIINNLTIKVNKELTYYLEDSN